MKLRIRFEGVRAATALVVGTLVSSILPVFAVPGGPFVAVSLDQAERLCRGNTDPPEQVRELGGMTRIAGMVYDETNHDVIFVGQAVPGEQAVGLDDLAVALRAVWVEHQSPFVSIDPTTNTARTGQQVVTYSKGLAQSGFGTDLLAADVVLKKLALGQIDATAWGLRSWPQLSADEWLATGKKANLGSRFWFYPTNFALANKDEGVIVISDLRIAVSNQVTSKIAAPSPSGDAAAEKFAARLTEASDQAVARYQEVARLQPLFGLVGIVSAWKKAAPLDKADYWLETFKPKRVVSPEQYNLLMVSNQLQRAGEQTMLVIEGGVELKARIADLKEGDATAFKRLVLESRPSRNSVVWKVPFEGWEIPGYAATLSGGREASAAYRFGELDQRPIGCFLQRSFMSSGDLGRGGVPMDLITPKPFVPPPPQPAFFDTIRSRPSATPLAPPALSTASRADAISLAQERLGQMRAQQSAMQQQMRQQQADMLDQQSEMRWRQSEMIGHQQEIMDQMKQQAGMVGPRELLGATQFRGNSIMEPAQKFEPGLSADVLNEISQNEEKYRRQFYGNAASLDYSQRQTIRQLAVDQFFAEHASYRVPGFGGYSYSGEKFGEIENKIIPTGFGSVNLDWASALGHAQRTSGISAESLYWTGKTLWNIVAPITGEKKLPEMDYLYPIPDQNTFRWIKALYDSRQPLRDTILPAWQRGAAPVAAMTASTHTQPLPCSPVGGVYLGGAGRAVAGLGTLKGICTNANGNLVLVCEEGGDVKLPPLRMDDLVTVFRSVYINGEGPTVTIDPNPEDPEKSAMVIVHSEATRDTYVGWVLYEADRLMKGYTLGVDNITTSNVVSRVPGYRDVVDAIYFGGGDPRKDQKQGIWERFWIVPAEADRFEGSRQELTLFDVPLKVKTQKMKWQKNKLEDDLTGKSSPGAQAFTSWFTRNYDAISAEQYLLPPPETGLTNPVPVFAELRRVALMTAIAEKLRDQGVPMPFWMWDYEVKPVRFEKTTPAMEVTRSNQKVEARIFGGVELSPESKSVKTYATTADVAKAPPEVRAEVDRSVKLADRLEKMVAAALPPVDSAPMTVVRVEDGNRAYQAVSLPGTDSVALDPCRLNEADITVPVAGGQDIRLVRSFNSFFDPKGPWGRGWALDLPRLQETQMPTHLEGGKTSYATCYELITPLNSFHARFSKARPVPELQNSKLQVPDQDGPFYGLANDHPKFLNNVETTLLYLKDGMRWHFTPQGDLVAIEEGPQVTVYERGSQGQVTRIVALVGGTRAAQIELDYTSEGVLSKAVGTTSINPKAQPIEASYTYNPAGRLAGVRSAEGTLGYSYQGPWVAAVTWTGNWMGAQAEPRSTFEYNAQGQLTAEKRGDSNLRYAITATRDGGVETSVKDTTDSAHTIATRYDRQMRPVEATDADGTHTVWNYQPDGGIQSTVTTPDSRKVTVTDTAGGRKRTVQADGEPEITAQYDAGGHLTTLSENGVTLREQTWLTDGRMAKVVAGTHAASFEYSDSGLLSSVVEHPSNENGRFQHWQETTYDRRGYPTGLTDFSGLDVAMAYDAAGNLVSMAQKTPQGNAGYNIERDAAGRVQAVKSTWGDTSYAYSEYGDLRHVETKRGNEAATVELSSGLVSKITSFDQGVTTFDYADKGDMTGALRGVTCANGLKLANVYDPQQRLAAVAMGAERRVSLDYDAKGRVVGYALEPLTP